MSSFRTMKILETSGGGQVGTINGISLTQNIALVSTDGSVQITSLGTNIDLKVNSSPGGGTLQLIAPPTGIAAYKLVALQQANTMVHADQAVAAQMPTIGMVSEAVAPNTAGEVTTAGEIANPGWNFTPRAILFAGNDGEITTVAPMSGYLQRVGVALSSTRILLAIESPVRRA